MTIVSDRIARAFNRSEATPAVVLDMPKAFNRVYHATLLHKQVLVYIMVRFLTLFVLFSVIGGFDGSGWEVFIRISSYAGVPQGSILGATLFLLYINDLPDDVICNIAIYTDDTTLYSKCNQWKQPELAAELESDLRDIVDWGRKWLVDFSFGNTQLVSFGRSNKTGDIDMKMDGSVLEENSFFLWLTFSFKLD